MSEPLRQELCRVGASLFARGYVHATAGNLSARTDDGVLITPTDACLGHLDPQRLACVDESGAQRDGDRASKTLALHRAHLRRRPRSAAASSTATARTWWR